MGEKPSERATWLRYEFTELIELYQRHDVTARELAERSSKLTSTEELDELGDELLQHTFWAMQHVLHRPACWAPKPNEIEYVLRCLRDEETFDPEAIEFTFDRTA
jgi:hypothetical protein